MIRRKIWYRKWKIIYNVNKLNKFYVIRIRKYVYLLKIEPYRYHISNHPKIIETFNMIWNYPLYTIYDNLIKMHKKFNCNNIYQTLMIFSKKKKMNFFILILIYIMDLLISIKH